MVELYDMKMELSHCCQSLAIYDRDGKQILYIREIGAPEKAWETIWHIAREEVENYTGISIMSNWYFL